MESIRLINRHTLYLLIGFMLYQGIFIILLPYISLFYLSVLFLAPIVLALIFIYPVVGLFICFFMAFSELLSGLAIGGHLFLIISTLTFISIIVNRLLTENTTFFCPKQFIVFLSFMGYALFSVLISQVSDVSIKTLILWGKNLIFFFMILLVLDNKEKIRNSIFVAIFALVVSILYGMYLKNHVNIGFVVFQRLRGVATDPNVFAIILVSIIPVTLFLMEGERHLWRKIIFAFVSVLLSFSVLASFSRGGAIGLAFVFCAFIYHKRKSPKVLLSVLFFVFVSFLLLPPNIWLRLESIIHFRTQMDMSLFFRINAAKLAVTTILQNPISGIGFGNFPDFAGTRVPFRYDLLRAHNMYLEVGAETGLIGLGIFLLLIYFTVREFRKSCLLFQTKGDYSMANISRGLLIGFCGFLVSALFLSIQQHLVFLIFIAYSSILRRLAEK